MVARGESCGETVGDDWRVGEGEGDDGEGVGDTSAPLMTGMRFSKLTISSLRKLKPAIR